MIVCRQCQFENPSHHKFCQRCGTSLIQKPCPECGTPVMLNALNCGSCGALTGTVWLAVVTSSLTPLPCEVESQMPQGFEADRLLGVTALSPDSPNAISDVIQVEQPDATLKESAPSVPTPTEEESEIEAEIPSTDSVLSPATEEENWLSKAFDARNVPAVDALTQQESSLEENTDNDTPESPEIEMGDYLDPGKRYQLLEALPKLYPSETILLPVLDTQPLQISPLKAAQQTAATSSDVKMETFIIAAAQAYLALKSQFPQQLPTVQDAWESDSYKVLVLKDYSDLATIPEKLNDDQTPTEQVVGWLQEMATLWAAFEPWHCRQSLLELNNIYVSAVSSDSVCLQQLYPDSSDSTPTLSDLGQFWKTLLKQSQRTFFGSVTELLRDLSEDKISTLEQLQQRLKEAQLELNPEPSTPEIPPISSPTRIQFEAVEHQALDASEAPTVPRLIQLSHLEAVGATDIGRQRDHNEDSFGVQTLLNTQQTPSGAILEAKGLYILCDGMGGHARGEVASQLAVETLKQSFAAQQLAELPSKETIADAIIQANSVIYQENQQEIRSGVGRMGTTLVMAIVVNNQIAVAHVGDSRLYRFSRSRGLEQITQDHEVGQREIQRGVSPEIAYTRPDAYQLTQALGPRDQNFLKPDIQVLEVYEDSLLILASDGLTDNDFLDIYSQTRLEPLLNPTSDLNSGVKALVELANQHNGHDNITTIVIRGLVQR